MKRLLAFNFFILMFAAFLSSNSSAQSQFQEILYLKNGSIIKGTIIEQIPDKSIKIQTKDDNIFVYEWSQIEKITKEIPKQVSYEVNNNIRNNSNDYTEPVRETNSNVYSNSPAYSHDNTGLFVRANFDYGFKANSEKYYSYEGSQTSVAFQSLGKGITIGGAIGYMFSNYFGMDVNAQYLIGTSVECNDNYSATLTNSKYSSSSFSIIPEAILQVPGFSKNITPYSKIGLILAFPKVGIIKNVATKQSSGLYNTLKYEYEDYGGMSMGVATTLGTNVVLNRSISVFAELLYNNLIFVPNKKKMISKYSNGIDVTHTVANPDVNYAATSNSSDIFTFTQESYQFSNIGFNLGLQINF